MKPLLPLTLLALLLTACAWAVTETNAPRIYVNGLPAFAKATAGKPLRSASGKPAAVIVKDGVTYVPLRAVAEALGCTVDYACPERSRGDAKSARDIRDSHLLLDSQIRDDRIELTGTSLTFHALECILRARNV